MGEAEGEARNDDRQLRYDQWTKHGGDICMIMNKKLCFGRMITCHTRTYCCYCFPHDFGRQVRESCAVHPYAHDFLTQYLTVESDHQCIRKRSIHQALFEINPRTCHGLLHYPTQATLHISKYSLPDTSRFLSLTSTRTLSL